MSTQSPEAVSMASAGEARADGGIQADSAYVWTRDAVVSVARSLIGVRYRHQGFSRLGCDCIGLIALVGIELAMPSALAWARDPQMHNYGPRPDPAVLMAAVAKYMKPVDPERVQVGDVLVMRWEDDPQHFAIVTALTSDGWPANLIHSYAAVHKVSEHHIEGEWRKGTTWRSRQLSAWSYQEVCE